MTRDGDEAEAAPETDAAAAAEGEAAGPPAAEGGGTEPGAAEEPGGAGPAEREPAAVAEDGGTEKSAAGPDGQAPGTEGAASAVSEAQAELAAQRELRARIEQRKAEKAGPVAAGGRLSGRAADLLAAVRAVESGATPDPAVLRPSPPPGPAEPERTVPAPERVSVAGAVAPTPPAEAVADVRAVLSAGGAPEALAGQVAAVLGERAADALRADPWQLLAVPGVRLEQVDGFARALLGAECGPGDGRRAVALVSRLLERAAAQGHTALDASSVRAALAGHSFPDPEDGVRHAVAEGAVLVFREASEATEMGTEAGEGPEAEPAEGAETAGPEDTEAVRDVPVLLGLDRFALAEESLADGIARLVKTAAAVPAAPWEEAARAAGPAASSRDELFRAVAGHGLVLHTGGEAARAEPVALVEAAGALGLRAVMATHSENGRARLGSGAATVAGLLAGTEGPGRDGEGTLALDLLVVLDTPQLDVETAAALVESLADGSRLVLSGDPGVLWSAGAGRVFADLLAARVCPQIASRVPDPGPLGELVSGIGVGELNQVQAPDKEIVIVPVRDAGEAVHRTVQLVADSVPRAFGVTAEQTQVITVGHGGSAGTRALNAALKQRLCPGPGRFGGFDPGDRVAYAPSPGTTVQGSVVSADAEGLRLDCGGTAVTVPRERVETAVRHGWALTAHQAAGMRWPAAVVVLPGDAAQGLSRPWVYTAFGRGERHLSVVHGVDQALQRAVAEDGRQERVTRLRELVEELLTEEPS